MGRNEDRITPVDSPATLRDNGTRPSVLIVNARSSREGGAEEKELVAALEKAGISARSILRNSTDAKDIAERTPKAVIVLSYMSAGLRAEEIAIPTAKNNIPVLFVPEAGALYGITQEMRERKNLEVVYADTKVEAGRNEIVKKALSVIGAGQNQTPTEEAKVSPKVRSEISQHPGFSERRNATAENVTGTEAPPPSVASPPSAPESPPRTKVKKPDSIPVPARTQAAPVVAPVVVAEIAEVFPEAPPLSAIPETLKSPGAAGEEPQRVPDQALAAPLEEIKKPLSIPDPASAAAPVVEIKNEPPAPRSQPHSPPTIYIANFDKVDGGANVWTALKERGLDATNRPMATEFPEEFGFSADLGKVQKGLRSREPRPTGMVVIANDLPEPTSLKTAEFAAQEFNIPVLYVRKKDHTPATMTEELRKANVTISHQSPDTKEGAKEIARTFEAMIKSAQLAPSGPAR